ncbi:MAG: hypothetical protein E7494_03365 [Ruminococcus albus]|jgi:hypothetical protein|nr:hypothetical protein [Ruminococcus albus]
MPYDDLKYISERKKHVLLRDEIEEAIKAKNIDRGKIHEYSKQGYGDIISKFYFTFADIKNYPVGRQTLEEYNMHFREELYQEYIACSLNYESHAGYIQAIKAGIPDEDKLFLILSDGWVYEGEKDAMFDVLEEVYDIRDFYIISPKFSWFTAVSKIEDSACLYRQTSDKNETAR